MPYTYQITSKREHWRQSHDVISIFPEGNHIELEIYPGFGFSDSTKIRSRDNFPTPFDLIFHFYR